MSAQDALDYMNMVHDVAPKSFIIFKLCTIFEEGTGKKITKKSINDKKGVYSFIKDVLPLLKQLTPKMPKIEEDIIKNSIDAFALQNINKREKKKKKKK